MRYVKVPDNVQLDVLQEDGSVKEEAFPFLKWMKEFPLSDVKLGKTAKMLMAVSDILEKINDAIENRAEYLVLSDSEWDLVKPVIEEPTNPYNPRGAIKLVPFMRTFLNAPDADPRKKLEAVGE